MLFSNPFAQTPHVCGTPAEKSAFLVDYQAGVYDDYPMPRMDQMVLPIKVHITGEDDGTGYTPLSQIGRALRHMNIAMEQYDMQFFVQGDVHYIDNSLWHNHEFFFDGADMMTENNVPGAINIYFCADAAGNCGYFSPGRDAIAMNDDCVDEINHTLGHEVGHFLSLPHTFVGWEGTTYDDSQPTPNEIGGRGVELTDGSNCEQSADGFCDTPPDYLSFRWSCNADGVSFQEQFDPSGESFNSDGSLIMSYSTGECRNAFSQEQVDAMRANVNIIRPELLDHNRKFKTIPPCGQVKLSSPGFRDSLFFDEARLTWDAIRDVDYYTLQVSTNFNFSDLVIETTLQDTFYEITNLEFNKNYFWRVSAYAAHAPCHQPSSFSVFSISPFSSTADVAFEDEWTCYFDGNDLVVGLGHRMLDDSQLTIYDIKGRQCHSMIVESALTRTTLPHLSNGAYIVRIVSRQQQASKMLIKYD